MRADAHLFASCEVRSNFVSELCQIPREPPVRHRELPGDSDTHLCRGKWLIGSALVRFGVSARAGGINFQACSFNHSTSLRFRINELRAVHADFRCPSSIAFPFSGLHGPSPGIARELC